MSQRIKRYLFRIDVGTRKAVRDEISQEDTEMFLGGRVLGDKFLYEELSAGIDPLSPDNKLFFSTGPLTGTNAHATSRYIIHTKSPLTGLFLCSLSGGYFGPELKRTGHDMLIIEGRSEKPVYLVIRDDKIDIKDASHLRDMTTDITQELIKKELGDSSVKIACIGPAGERLVPFANVISERRAAGRGGAGAVMGSKNLKAVVVRGTNRVELSDPETFRDVVRRAYRDSSRNPKRKRSKLYGTNNAFSAFTEGGIIPWRNWQDGGSPKAKALFPETWRDKYVKKDLRCAPPCNLNCVKINMVTEGPYAGALSEGPDYEAVYSLGTCCDISDFGAIIQADALCDKYGLDTISMGVSIAFAMECYEKGIVNKEDTEGLELHFGNDQVLANLIRDTAFRQGFGKILSTGTRKMSDIFGKGSEAFAMHVNGMEIGGYDPRGAKSAALVYACGPRGGCHKSNGSANNLSKLELQSGDLRYSTEGKGILARSNRDKRLVTDSIIFCSFGRSLVSDGAIAELLNAATGFEWSMEELDQIGERGSLLERMFNVREGLRRSWDTLPPRLLNEGPASGPNMGQVVELEPLLDDFYKACGWDIETGIPTGETLNQLGLGKIAVQLDKDEKDRQ